MYLYVLSIFLASAQLFMIQPMFAKRLLPVLGGTPSVWTTCMLFYQVILLAGYAYAHIVGGLKKSNTQILIHSIMLLLPLAVLALGPPVLSPPDPSSAVPWLLRYLLVAIGAPFFVLSTNAPLVQKWFSLKFAGQGKSPYPLYSASNAGSMLALLAYPFLIEPSLRLNQQYTLLQVCYGAFLIVMIAIMSGLRDRQDSHAHAPLTNGDASLDSRQLFRQRAGWVFLAFIPSSLLLSVTTYITSDIAPCPLLWVLPLVLYLLTFIIAFAEKRLISQTWLVSLYSVFLILLAVAFYWKAVALNFVFMFPLHLLTFFFAALLCHTKLADCRPESSRLTEFYLCLSIGGALGGLFNTLVAPYLFKTLFEYPLGLLLSCAGFPNASRSLEKSNWRVGGVILASVLATTAVLLAISASWSTPWINYRSIVVIAPAAICCSFVIKRPAYMAMCLGVIFLVGAKFWRPDFLFEQRNIFGTLAVAEISSDTHALIHGTIVHGAERMNQGGSPEPLTYYHHESPIGHIFSEYGERWRSSNFAVIGLGTGSLAAYAQPDQRWTFYEINPLVVRVAQNPALFTYLSSMPAKYEIEIGDGRQSIAEARNKSLSLIVLDAFSSDSIPVHLLTREALQLYSGKLTDDGLIVFHISSRAVNLTPILRELAKDAGFACLVEQTGATRDMVNQQKFASKWLVMSRTRDNIESLQKRFRFAPPSAVPSASLWTDDFSNVFETLHAQGSL